MCERTEAGDKTRTCDRLITNQLLYQLSYTSDSDINAIKNMTEMGSMFKNFLFLLWMERDRTLN